MTRILLSAAFGAALAACGGPAPWAEAPAEHDGDLEGPLDTLVWADDEVEAEARDLTAGPGETVCVVRPPRARTKRVGAGGAARARFGLPGIPAVGAVRAAQLVFEAYDADRRGEGTLRLADGRPVRLPTRPRLRSRWRRFRVDVTGRVRGGDGRVTFRVGGSPEAAFRVRKVRLRLVGPGLACTAPPSTTPAPPAPPSNPGARLVQSARPIGVAAFAALEPSFPRRGLMRILGGLDKPYTSVLLDFGPAYARHGRQMFAPGRVGRRAPNPAHFDALVDFVQAFLRATPDASTRKLQLYVVNGPGMRRGGAYARAYPHGLADFDRAVRRDPTVRAELTGYLAALTRRLRPFEAQVDLRLVPSLEDNLSVAGFRAMAQLARDAGWTAPIGRNPCACGGYGDMARAGDFLEDHIHGGGAVRGLPGRLRAGDVVSNDGWGWTVPHAGRVMTDADVVSLVRQANRNRLWLNLWYDPIQGYPVPASGPRDYRFDDSPEHLLGLLRRGS